MKITLFQADKQVLFLEFFKNLLDNFYITLANVFNANQNVIKIHSDKNIKFFYLNFVDVVLEAGKGIKKTKKYDLVLKMAIPHLESYFLLIVF